VDASDVQDSSLAEGVSEAGALAEAAEEALAILEGYAFVSQEAELVERCLGGSLPFLGKDFMDG
jgi:hypothetical protein